LPKAVDCWMLSYTEQQRGFVQNIVYPRRQGAGRAKSTAAARARRVISAQRHGRQQSSCAAGGGLGGIYRCVVCQCRWRGQWRRVRDSILIRFQTAVAGTRNHKNAATGQGYWRRGKGKETSTRKKPRKKGGSRPSSRKRVEGGARVDRIESDRRKLTRAAAFDRLCPSSRGAGPFLRRLAARL